MQITITDDDGNELARHRFEIAGDYREATDYIRDRLRHALAGEHQAHVTPPRKTKKARRRSVYRWLLAHVLAPPPTIRPRRQRVRHGESVPERKQFDGPVLPEELSKRSTPDPAPLDFRALLEQSLVVTIAGSDQHSN
jgi:hypothetical protein